VVGVLGALTFGLPSADRHLIVRWPFTLTTDQGFVARDSIRSLLRRSFRLSTGGIAVLAAPPSGSVTDSAPAV